MPRIVHGTKPPEAINPNITLSTLQNLNNIDRSFSLQNFPLDGSNISSIGFALDRNGEGLSIHPHITPSHSAPNILK